MSGSSRKSSESILKDFFLFPAGVDKIENWRPSEEEKEALILYDTELNIIAEALSKHIEKSLLELESLEGGQEADTASPEDAELLHKQIQSKENELKSTLKNLLFVLKKHAYVHQHLLATNGQAGLLEERMDRIRGVLSQESLVESPTTSTDSPEKKLLPPGSTSLFRQIFIEVNWWRLFLIRIKRAGDAFAFISQTPIGYPQVTRSLSYLGWIFYAPRVAVNLFWGIQHSFFPQGEVEKTISWNTRLKTQLKRRWAELANDIVWMLVGLVNCFVLTGMAAMGLTTALYFFDVVVAGVRFYIERKRYKRIQSAMEHIKSAEGINSDDVKRLDQLLKILKEQLNEKRQMLGLSIATAAILAFCTSLFFFSLLGLPWLAPVAAGFILMTCIFSKLVFEPYIKKERELKDILLGAALTTAGASVIALGIFMATGLLASTTLAAPLVIAAGVLIVIAASILSYYLNSPRLTKTEDEKKKPYGKAKSFNNLMDECQNSIGSKASTERGSVFSLFSPNNPRNKVQEKGEESSEETAGIELKLSRRNSYP